MKNSDTLSMLDDGDKMTLWAALCSFDKELREDGLGEDEHGRFMTAAYQSRIRNLRSRIYPEFTRNQQMETETRTSEDSKAGPFEAAHNCDRIRMRTVLNLMGVDLESASEAGARLADAMREFPEGSLVFTHGPVDLEHPQMLTFETLIAMFWQDNDDGAIFNECIWQRQ